MDEEYFIEFNFDGKFFDHNNEYRRWLNGTIGRSNWQLYGFGTHHPGTIRFETREDALAFRLKFGL